LAVVRIEEDTNLEGFGDKRARAFHGHRCVERVLELADVVVLPLLLLVFLSFCDPFPRGVGGGEGDGCSWFCGRRAGTGAASDSADGWRCEVSLLRRTTVVAVVARWPGRSLEATGFYCEARGIGRRDNVVQQIYMLVGQA
jgi:hypothetical protein